ncbi:Class I SAM-dependent methyltransferase [Hyphomicrobiales bacterium]|nr:Class I SAM-dependent methyltransferase [Hyphomicrobiales bacterium]CAH1699069.1 Class I SAM-dependent methyltransferase [Hyphomicrobiales bacterium]CAI0342859.1 Class I SAM-dependent methyltransferase [Hyphomicrobiales bacterium]
MVRRPFDHSDGIMKPEPPCEAFHDLLRGMAALSGNRIVADVARLYGKGAPPDLSIACNHKQIASKQWLVEALSEACPKPDGPVWVLGAWYGVLGALLLDDERLSIGQVISLDIDPSCAPIAEILNHRHVASGRFRALTADMTALDFAAQAPRPGLVINTSCEHLADVPGWVATLPAGLPVLLQSNDYFREPDHCSCVASLDAFREQAGLGEVWFAGARPTKNYTRFMLIGRR